MSSAPQKVCTLCHKDVSNAKRVKDAEGHYYCEACHEAASKRQMAGAGATAIPAKSGAVALADADDDLLPLAPAEPRAAPRRAVAPESAGDSAKPAPLPEFCPNCGAKVFANRKFC